MIIAPTASDEVAGALQGQHRAMRGGERDVYILGNYAERMLAIVLNNGRHQTQGLVEAGGV